jgi:hypothetical protein
MVPGMPNRRCEVAGPVADTSGETIGRLIGNRPPGYGKR